MHKKRIYLLSSALLGVLVLLHCFCQRAYLQGISLSPEETMKIAERIFENECSSMDEYLLQWNEGEDFLSLGIGHFIWYPEDQEGPFDESFRDYLGFAKASGEEVPDWLGTKSFVPCPWDSREDFLGSRKDDRLIELREFLIATKPLQAEFMVERLKPALPLMLKNAPADERPKIKEHFNRIASVPGGFYALIDYVNFKGLGILDSERYNGEGWGLSQVLSEMKEEDGDAETIEEFAETAKRVLERRVANSPQGRNEERWLLGWKRRIDSYLE